jgi:hypothetical protein
MFLQYSFRWDNSLIFGKAKRLQHCIAYQSERERGHIFSEILKTKPFSDFDIKILLHFVLFVLKSNLGKWKKAELCKKKHCC